MRRKSTRPLQRQRPARCRGQTGSRAEACLQPRQRLETRRRHARHPRAETGRNIRRPRCTARISTGCLRRTFRSGSRARRPTHDSGSSARTGCICVCSFLGLDPHCAAQDCPAPAPAGQHHHPGTRAGYRQQTSTGSSHRPAPRRRQAPSRRTSGRSTPRRRRASCRCCLPGCSPGTSTARRTLSLHPRRCAVNLHRCRTHASSSDARARTLSRARRRSHICRRFPRECIARTAARCSSPPRHHAPDRAASHLHRTARRPRRAPHAVVPSSIAHVPARPPAHPVPQAIVPPPPAWLPAHAGPCTPRAPFPAAQAARRSRWSARPSRLRTRRRPTASRCTPRLRRTSRRRARRSSRTR